TPVTRSRFLGKSRTSEDRFRPVTPGWDRSSPFRLATRWQRTRGTPPPRRSSAATTLSVRRPSCDRRAVIAVSQPAPDAAFASRDGGVVRLSDLWCEKPTILLFLRHFG